MPTDKKRINMTLDPKIRDIIDDMSRKTAKFHGWPVSKIATYLINEGLKAAEEEAQAASVAEEANA